MSMSKSMSMSEEVQERIQVLLVEAQERTQGPKELPSPPPSPSLSMLRPQTPVMAPSHLQSWQHSTQNWAMDRTRAASTIPVAEARLDYGPDSAPASLSGSEQEQGAQHIQASA